jgi:hypothetical protein
VAAARVTIRARRLSVLGRLLGLDRIGRRGPFPIFLNFAFSPFYLIQKLILKATKSINLNIFKFARDFIELEVLRETSGVTKKLI